MVSTTRQVQQSRSRRAMLERLASPPGPFPEVVGAKRQYPGAVEGTYLASYLNELSARPKAQKAFADLISPLLKFEQGLRGGPKEPYTERDVLGAYDKLKQKIDRKGLARITKDGLVIPPTTSEGKAALAVVLLYQEYRRLRRIRQCLRCKAWFFAHLERQRFCNDPKKKCQWAYFHSPEWRRQNRERNRKHQREYRERVFGKRR